MLEIIQVNGGKNLESVKTLFEKYADSLGFDLDFQDFKSELANLPCDCAAPEGCLLFAVYQEQGAGLAQKPYC
jgi:hypothetical protein